MGPTTIMDCTPQVLEAAVALAREAQAARQFTDTSQFALRCLVCQKGLVGQEDAVKHATETGHQNFSEY
jgi:ubiquitin thioesterase OTU1